MASELPYMKLWVDDVLADIQELGLSDEEFGAYMKLLLIAWKKEHIHADVKANARYVSATPNRFKKLWASFRQKWVSNGNGGLVNPRQEKERAEALAKSEKASRAAKERWRQEHERREQGEEV